MRAPAPAAGVLLLHGAEDAPPAWGVRGGIRAWPLPPAAGIAPDGVAPSAELAEVLSTAECVLVDAQTLDALGAARRAHQADPDVQVVIVVAGEDGRRALERALLFAPGIGEVWLASPGEVAAAVEERAIGVTRQRRKFRRTRERMERERLVASPQRTERALISDEYLANLLQVLAEPVLSLDPAGRILSANPAARRVLAASGTELVGVPLASTVHLHDAAALAPLLSGASDQPLTTDVEFPLPDGSAGHGELSVSRVAGSEPALFAVVLHDLTERARAQRQLEDQALELEHQASVLQEQAAELEQSNDELQRQQAELESALASRSRFYAAMSHELRTPINAVMGYAGLALEGIYGPLSEPLRDALVRSQRAANHLRELVDDVLDLAKIEAGRIEVARETVDARALAEDILLSVRPTAEASGTTVMFECNAAPASPLVTDPRRVRQILLNLLGNALKFSGGRPVVLWCSAPRGAIAFSVVDQGPGIPETDHQRIFEEFVQLDPERHRGTGLGLPISRRLAEMLGGTLTVASAPGQGSTFTLTLPLA